MPLVLACLDNPLALVASILVGKIEIWTNV